MQKLAHHTSRRVQKYTNTSLLPLLPFYPNSSNNMTAATIIARLIYSKPKYWKACFGAAASFSRCSNALISSFVNDLADAIVRLGRGLPQLEHIVAPSGH
jgi:hypothetical protein